MALRGQIVRLTRYAKKGDPGEELQGAVLVENAGLEGDWHAGGGERQICLLSLEARQWMDGRKARGICFRRFKENILFDKVPLAALAPGTRMRAGETVLEISAPDKHCFDECPLYERGRTCILAGLNVFARVVKGGRLRPGDEIAVLEKPGV